MTTKFVHRRTEVLAGLRQLRTAAPEVMAGFGQLHKASLAEGALSTKTKEMIALAIGVSSRCEGCIALHAHAALKAGATVEEITEALGVAVLMGGGPASIYAAEAMEAVEQYRRSSHESGVER